MTTDIACASLEPFYADWIVALPEGVEPKVCRHLQRGSFFGGLPAWNAKEETMSEERRSGTVKWFSRVKG